MIISNDPKNLPHNILSINLGLRNTEVLQFLDTLTTQGLGNGVKRKDYYVVSITGMLRIPGTVNQKLAQIFVKFIQLCQHKGHTLLMIKL